MCQFDSQKANYRNSTTQIRTDREQNTNETGTTKTNKQTNKQKNKRILFLIFVHMINVVK
jgi:hypothetical protein